MSAPVAEGGDFLWVDDTVPMAAPVAPPRRGGRDPVRADGRHLPAEAGLWIFVLGDMSIFGAFFGVYCWELRADRDVFASSASALHQPIGLLNTLVLLASSYAVVVALHAQRAGRPTIARRALTTGLVCGAAFLCSKAVEYTMEIEAGHSLGSNVFFTFYFVLTGVHALHVLIGMSLLAVWRRRTADGSRPQSIGYAEGAAVYWHMVDLLWLVIFALLYLGAAA